MAKSNIKPFTNLVTEVTKSLNDGGIRISQRAVQIVLQAYYDAKRVAFSEGYAIVEEGACTTEVLHRRSNTFKDGVISTAKLSSTMPGDLKDIIIKNLYENEEVRERLGGTEVTEEDLLKLATEFEKEANKNA